MDDTKSRIDDHEVRIRVLEAENQRDKTLEAEELRRREMFIGFFRWVAPIIVAIVAILLKSQNP